MVELRKDPLKKRDGETNEQVEHFGEDAVHLSAPPPGHTTWRGYAKRASDTLTPHNSFEITSPNEVYFRNGKRGYVDRDKEGEELNKIFQNASAKERDGLIALIRLLLANSLPEEAPELYEMRSDKSESPPEFIRRTYSDFFDQGLTLATLRKLDPKLRRALDNWCYRNRTSPSKVLGIQKKSESNDAVLQELPEHFHDKIVQLGGAIARRR